ncbi:hypothetical protein PF003_g11665 [Phytophthora fragariae]|nr:hypothetical protein PF003_g11665 [Phytophthora fragariae]
MLYVDRLKLAHVVSRNADAPDFGGTVGVGADNCGVDPCQEYSKEFCSTLSG